MSPEDGKNWTKKSELSYNELGDVVKDVYYGNDGTTVKEWKYTYDDHGNWTKMTDGDEVYIREIQYYD